MQGACPRASPPPAPADTTAGRRPASQPSSGPPPRSAHGIQRWQQDEPHWATPEEPSVPALCGFDVRLLKKDGELGIGYLDPGQRSSFGKYMAGMRPTDSWALSSLWPSLTWSCPLSSCVPVAPLRGLVLHSEHAWREGGREGSSHLTHSFSVSVMSTLYGSGLPSLGIG